MIHIIVIEKMMIVHNYVFLVTLASFSILRLLSYWRLLNPRVAISCIGDMHLNNVWWFACLPFKNYCSFDIFVITFSSQFFTRNLAYQFGARILSHPIHSILRLWNWKVLTRSSIFCAKNKERTFIIRDLNNFYFCGLMAITRTKLISSVRLGISVRIYVPLNNFWHVF